MMTMMTMMMEYIPHTHARARAHTHAHTHTHTHYTHTLHSHTLHTHIGTPDIPLALARPILSSRLRIDTTPLTSFEFQWRPGWGTRFNEDGSRQKDATDFFFGEWGSASLCLMINRCGSEIACKATGTGLVWSGLLEPPFRPGYSVTVFLH